jgi:hypothetical protein
MSIDFIDDGVHQFLYILLPKRLLKTHDVTHHGEEHSTIPHLPLLLNVGVVEAVFNSFSHSEAM